MFCCCRQLRMTATRRQPPCRVQHPRRVELALLLQSPRTDVNASRESRQRRSPLHGETRGTRRSGQKRDLGDPSLALSDGCNGLRIRSLKLASNRANLIPLRRLPPRRSWFQSPVSRVQRREWGKGFRQSGADWETAAACVKMETESSVLIRPLIATPAQEVSRS